jgi:putative endonuclease
MPDARSRYGRTSESVAVRHLKKNGYRILERNYRNNLGEIDIIAKDKDTIVFVEVKARRTNRYGDPKWSVTPKKQRKISMVALSYLKTINRSNGKARFDVVSIRSASGTPRIEIVKNAFELAYE